jgi:PD-(D/E)XK endonuclease
MRKSVRLVWEHLFVSDNPNLKGNIAEAAIALAALKAGVAVFQPVAEHGRTDLVFEIGEQLHRVQCKWGRLDRGGDVIVVGVESNRCTPNGYIRTRYERGEIELLAVYCGDLDRCYLLPQSLFVGKRAVQLRLQPPKNGQRSCINLAEDYEFDGAVAQLARAPAWHAGGRGFESPQLHSEPPIAIGSDEFRNRLGYYLDLAAEGQELTITRWGKRFLRVTLWQPQLPEAHGA